MTVYKAILKWQCLLSFYDDIANVLYIDHDYLKNWYTYLTINLLLQVKVINYYF